MGNQNIQASDKKNILIVGSEYLEENDLGKFFKDCKIETIGNLENIKITMIQRKNQDECGVWFLRYNDLNFINSINVLIKTIKISGLVICFAENDQNIIQSFKVFLKQYTCEEYLRGISLGVLVIADKTQNIYDQQGLNKNQEIIKDFYLRQLKIEKELHLRDLDPRIIKQIQILDLTKATQVNEFLEKILDAMIV